MSAVHKFAEKHWSWITLILISASTPLGVYLALRDEQPVTDAANAGTLVLITTWSLALALLDYKESMEAVRADYFQQTAHGLLPERELAETQIRARHKTVAAKSVLKGITILGASVAVLLVAGKKSSTQSPVESGNLCLTDSSSRAAEVRLTNRLQPKRDQQRVIYARWGMGLLAPQVWSLDSEVYRFGGGESGLVKAYDASGSVSAGMLFTIRTIQSNYITDPESETRNKYDVVHNTDPKATMFDTAIDGKLGKGFDYQQKTGTRIGHIRLYWFRIMPRIKLEVLIFSNSEGSRDAFLEEASSVLQSITIDEQYIRDKDGVMQRTANR